MENKQPIPKGQTFEASVKLLTTYTKDVTTYYLGRERIKALVQAHEADKQAAVRAAEAKTRLELTKELRAVYHAPSRDGGKMFDFAGVLDGQIEAFEAELAALDQPTGGEK